MSQCVPNWDLDDAVPSRFDLHPHPSTSGPDVPMIDYEMAELTWENGQLSMQGLGLRRVSSKPSICTSFPNTKCAWERPRAAPGTLESIVNLATQKTPPPHCSLPGGAAAVTMDTLVPCKAPDEAKTVPRVVGCSTRVDSCSGAAAATTCQLTTKAVEDGDEGSVLKKTSFVPHVSMTGQQSVSVSRSGTMGVDSWHVPTVDTCENELGGFGVTSTSFGSQGNTLSSSGLLGTNNTTTLDDHDSVCHSRPPRDNGNEEERKRNGKSSSSTRRSRAAAIHNQSERKRRDKINQKMKMLQKLVPNSNKTDKASMLDEVIDYLKQLQAQVHMMSRMHTIPPMMMPHQLAMQQQLQMSMMAAAAAASTPMGMGMGMGMAAMPGPMDMNMNINPVAARQNLAAAFMPVAAAAPSPDGQATALAVPTDPISTYLACQPQPMSVDAYSRMIAVIQQQQQQLASASKH